MSLLLDTESSTKEQYQYEKKNSDATMHVNGHTAQDAKPEMSKFFLLHTYSQANTLYVLWIVNYIF